MVIFLLANLSRPSHRLDANLWAVSGGANPPFTDNEVLASEFGPNGVS